MRRFVWPIQQVEARIDILQPLGSERWKTLSVVQP
jgi:hypothetical protein